MRALLGVVRCVESLAEVKLPEHAERCEIASEGKDGLCGHAMRNSVQPHGGVVRNRESEIHAVPATFMHVNDHIDIDLEQPFDTNGSFSVHVEYSGAPFHSSVVAGYSGAHGTFAVDVIATHSQPFKCTTKVALQECNRRQNHLDFWGMSPEWMIVASNGRLKRVDEFAGTAKWLVDRLAFATVGANGASSVELKRNLSVRYMDVAISMSDNTALSHGVIDNDRVISGL